MARSTLITYVVLGLTAFGLVMVGDASLVAAAADFGDKWYYLKLQIGWAALGVMGFFLTSRWSYQVWQKLSPLLFLVNLALLVVVLLPGVGIQALGATRWLGWANFSFQPAEMAKLTVALYLASLLKLPKALFTPFLLTVVVVGGLILLEPDLGTAVVIAGMALLTYFGSGGKLTRLALLLPAVAAAAAVVIAASPYRVARVRTFLDASGDPLGAAYHSRQILLALGSGGVWGTGWGQSRQKYEFLPEVTTDSIFAVIGEELGLVGGTGVVLTYLFLVYQGLKVAAAAPDQFGANLAVAITGWIGLQAFINIAAMVALVPLTGIPLPFISYGGSSLVVALVGSGLLVNIARQS